MASYFPTTVAAYQVGNYFVRQYYHVLQQRPDHGHQFYNEASTMLLIDGDKSESASGMLQIHSLITSLNFTGIEIKSVHSLDSWNGGIMVVVSGSVQTSTSNGRRAFVQTFFLPPQERGYYVLTDIFHFIDEQVVYHPPNVLPCANFEQQMNVVSSISEPEFFLTREVESNDFLPQTHVEETSATEEYSYPEQQHVPEANNFVEETEDLAPYAGINHVIPEMTQAPVEEPSGEPVKQTYASILRLAKGSGAPLAPPLTSVNKVDSGSAEWQSIPQPPPYQSYQLESPPSDMFEKSLSEAADELTIEDDGEIRSVYVRNLPTTVSALDIEQEFQAFGRIKEDGVVVRSRKEIGICYAFIEFEDASSVQSAVQASPLQFAGRPVYVEERRVNNSSVRGRGRGRGRGGYQTESLRGRSGFGFGMRSFSRGIAQEGSDSSRTRGNGYHRGPLRQDRVVGYQATRNGQNF